MPKKPLEARAIVEHHADRTPTWSLQLWVDGAPRRLEANDCDELANITAYVLGLALTARTETADVNPSTVEPRVASVRVKQSRVGTESTTSTKPEGKRAVLPEFPRAAFGVGFAVGGGPLPDANLGATIRGSLLLRRWQFDAAYHHWIPNVAVAADAPAVGADIALFSAVVRACPRWDVGPVELGACGSLDVGLLRVEPVGLDRGRIARSIWTAVGAGGVFAWPFAREAALTLRAEAVVPFARPEFNIEFAGLVHRVAPAGGRGIVGIEVRFP